MVNGYTIPIIVGFALLSPTIFRIFKILTLKYIHRWQHLDFMERTKNPRMKQKILNESKKILNRDYYLSSLIKNPSLTYEEVLQIATIGGNETRAFLLEKHQLPANILKEIAEDEHMTYTTWYRLLEQENTPEDTKVMLALSFPEYIKRKQDGITPREWDIRYFPGF